MEKKIIITKPGTLSAKDKEKLAKNGFLVIEHPEPHSGICFTTAKESVEYVYDNCCNCGERIYFTKERKSALKTGKKTFYCTQGHAQSYQ